MSCKKTVPVLRFKGFEEDWKEKTLAEITTYVDYRGKTPTKVEKGTLLVTARNVKMGFIDYTASAEFINESEYDEVMRRGYPIIGDILITTEAPLGNIAQIDRADIALAQRVIKLSGKYFIDNTFLKHNLIAPYFQKILDSHAYGSTVKGIKGAILKMLPVSFPNLTEQQKIAGFLSDIDTKIEKLARKKELTDQFKKGMMQKLFSQEIRFKDDSGKEFPEWEEKQLGEVCLIYDGTHITPNYVDEGIPFYSVEHLTKNNFSDTKFIAHEVFEKEQARVKLEHGDILMTRIGDIGTAKYIDWDIVASFYVSLALLKKKIPVEMKYISHMIESVDFQKELHHRTIHVAFPKKINLGEIGNCKLPFPSIPEQQKIASLFTDLDTKITTIGRELSMLKEFKRGLLQQMFV